MKLAHNRAGANLVSGVASALLASDGADLGLFEVDEGAFPDIAGRIRPQAVCLGNLFRDQLDRYGELEHIAERWRTAVADLDPAAWTVVNADDPLLADIARGRAEALRFGIDDPPSPASASPTPPTRSTAARAGRPTTMRPRTSAISATTAARAATRPGLRSTWLRGRSSSRASRAPRSTSSLRKGRDECRSPSPGSTTSTTRSPRPRSRSSSAPAWTTSRPGSSGSVRPSGASSASRRATDAVLLLLVKNPAGANEVVRTLVDAGAPVRLLVALNDAIADGRDVSWIWDVDFEPLVGRPPAARRERRSRGRSSALRFKYGGLDRDADRDPARPRAGARSRARADPARRRARRPPHVHGDARAARRSPPSRARAPVLGGGAREDRVGAPLPRVPEHLRRSRQHRRPQRVRRCAGTSSGRPAIEHRRRVRPGEHDLLYIGGGQDREQALDRAATSPRKGAALVEAVEAGAALLAVCGGYQLLGRGYRGRDGSLLPGVGLFPHETVAGERRMIGDVLLECELEPGDRGPLAGFENHAGRTLPRRGRRAARARGVRLRERRRGRASRAADLARGRHLPARPAAAAQSVARRLAARPRAGACGCGEPPELDPLGDELEAGGESSSPPSGRGSRGGRF